MLKKKKVSKVMAVNNNYICQFSPNQ